MCVFCYNLLKDYMLELMVSMCVFCWNLLTDYMRKLIVFNVCVLLEFVERLYAEIDGFQSVFYWNLLKEYMLELMVSMCVFC
jgi:hypothetical protein